ncbi:MAG: transglycosylase SLT domain-containing protein [Candidatus Binataceae bacterium]
MSAYVLSLQEQAAAARRKAREEAAARAAAALAAAPPPTPTATYQAPPPAVGDYSYAGLEQIWEANGGSAATANVAACIATHESGGNPGAISPTDDYGLWQIHDNPAALNPNTSAAIAVAMSSDGTNWSPWTTASDCGV